MIGLHLLSLLTLGLIAAPVAASTPRSRPRYTSHTGPTKPKRSSKAQAKRKRKLAEKSRRRNRR